jgi:NADH-quinone oxidoreductase subunit J
MNLPFLILAILTLAGGVAAMTLRRLVHCALALTVAFAGLAALYLNLGAEFAGLAQLLVYVGAIAILIVFVILLTRGGDDPAEPSFSPASLSGMIVAFAVFAVLAWAVETSSLSHLPAAPQAPAAPMQQIGLTLMQRYVLPLEVIGLMLTAAMIGAVVIALRDRRSASAPPETETAAR